MGIFSQTKILSRGIWRKAARHRVASVFILIAVLYGSYYVYGKLGNSGAETRYVLVAAARGTLVASVTGSGQVSVLNQLDIKPKISGDVKTIAVPEGQAIKSGALIIQLDASDAEKAVRDAETNLVAAQIALRKLKEPADALSIIQAENALTEADQLKQNSTDDLTKAYSDGFNAISNAFMDLPGVMTGLDSVLNSQTVKAGQDNADAYYDMISAYAQNAGKFHDMALASYATALTLYNKNLQDYKNASPYSDRVTIDSLINETYDTAKSISGAVKDIKSFLDLVNDTLTSGALNIKAPTILSTHESSLQTYTGTVNTHLNDLLNIENTIKNDEDAIVNANHAITEKTEALAKLKAGADPLDIQSQELAVQQRQNALLDARETFADSFIRAPFDGILAKVNVKKGDPVSPSVVVATVITSQQIAQVSLNEVDVAKVKIGQKATLTFDALPDLSITGEVAQIDTIGTVVQGVVTYDLKIVFDTQDARVRPGMSVSAAVITNVSNNALVVPNSAVKTQGSTRYVEILNGISVSSSTLASQGVVSKVPPIRQAVEIGLYNDNFTEVTNGLQEGDLVVSRVISASTQGSSPQTGGTSGFRIPGLGGGGR